MPPRYVASSLLRSTDRIGRASLVLRLDDGARGSSLKEIPTRSPASIYPRSFDCARARRRNHTVCTRKNRARDKYSRERIFVDLSIERSEAAKAAAKLEFSSLKHAYSQLLRNDSPLFHPLSYLHTRVTCIHHRGAERVPILLIG